MRKIARRAVREFSGRRFDTVFPLTSAVVDAFTKRNPGVKIAVHSSGTTAGFQAFCRGASEIQNASRPINTAEQGACAQANVTFIELPVAQDAITVIVHPQNDWATSLTLAELKKMWEPAAEGRVVRWSDVHGGWPAEPIHLFGPGALSGTFDFFTEVIGTVGSSRKDYTASEDDGVILKGVEADRLALGYLGYGYYEGNKAALRAVAIAGPNAERLGPVVPSSENVRRGVYDPLSRMLFIYVNAQALDRPEVSAFVRFYLDQDESLIRKVGGIPLSTRGYELVKQRMQKKVPGSLFSAVKPSSNVEQLLSAASTPR